MNQTYEFPQNLGDLMDAYDEAHWQTDVLEIKSAIGVLKRGTILASGNGADIGKLLLLSATMEAQAYGVLLDLRSTVPPRSVTAASPVRLPRQAASRGTH